MTNFKFQIGMVVSALIGSVISSNFAVAFVNENPRKGYLTGIAIVLFCLILAKALKKIQSTTMSERNLLLIIWLSVHLIGLAGFIIIDSSNFSRDTQFWIYFRSVLGAGLGFGIAIFNGYLFQRK